MQVFGRTEIGYRRSMNQDYCDWGFFSDDAVWVIVCDGMGGAAAGNIASMITTNSVKEYIVAHYNPSMKPAQIESMLTNAVEEANTAVFDLANDNPEYYGMGTTIVACVVKDRCAYLVHVGDSRAYLVTQTGAEKLTVDHSMVEELIMLGQLTREEARNHPKRNIITRAIGVQDEVDVEYDFVMMDEGNVLLLCTDGLSNSVDEDAMFSALGDHNLSEYTDVLVEKALSDGGNDNITVCTVKI